MREITTETEINASPAAVWRVLTDLPRFSEWNPFIPEAEGEAREGARLSIRIAPQGGRAMSFKPTVTRIRAEREFRWLGRLFVPGLFDGEHIFEIEPIGGQRVRFTQRERFKGLLVPLVWGTMAPATRRGFEDMNQALKRRVEEAET